MCVRRSLQAMICAGACGLAVQTSHAQENIDARLVAVQVRSQGFECTEPVSAEPVQSESGPDERAYLLQCGNATYRVRLVPDQAAAVEQVK